jgi:hypothetical protein
MVGITGKKEILYYNWSYSTGIPFIFMASHAHGVE